MGTRDASRVPVSELLLTCGPRSYMRRTPWSSEQYQTPSCCTGMLGIGNDGYGVRVRNASLLSYTTTDTVVDDDLSKK